MILAASFQTWHNKLSLFIRTYIQIDLSIDTDNYCIHFFDIQEAISTVAPNKKGMS